MFVAAALGGVLALGGAAWALTRPARNPAPPSTPAPALNVAPTTAADSRTRLTTSGTTSATTTTVQNARRDTAAFTAQRADSIRRAQLVARRRVLAESTRAARNAPVDNAVLTIEGDLPAGWVRSVGAGGASSARSSARSVPLRPGVESVIVVEAPGYCPDTLRITLDVGGRQEWEPTLRGRPVIGGCSSN